MTIEPITKKSKSEQVCEFILEYVSSGEWPPKSKLPNETQLAEMFGVSRVSIRQAVSQLTGQGVLDVRQGDGTYVNEVLSQDYLGRMLQMVVMDTPSYLEIQDFRRIMEPMIAYAVALQATDEMIYRLRDCIKKQQDAMENNDLKAYLAEDSEFHNLLAECTGNGLIVKQMHLVQDLLCRAMEHTGMLSGYTDGLEYHIRICNSLAERDADGARDHMLCHINNNIQLVKLEKKTKRRIPPT